MAGQGFYIGNVEGLEEVYAALEKFKPDLQKALVEKMEAEANALVQAIDGATPGVAPMSGFEHSGRTSWARRGHAYVKPGAPKVGAGGKEWPVFKVAMGGYATAVADIAGAGSSGHTASGQNMIGVLNSRLGRASRWVWPTAKAAVGRIEKRVEAISREVENKVSAKLRASAGG